MAHEITRTDGLVLHKAAAWHGLGTIVQDAPSPAEALKIAGLDWEVQQWALSATDGEAGRVAIASHVANIRTDTGKVLGIVGRDWTPFQNAELADFCDALSANGPVKIETAGSIRGGEKVWFLLKGDSFGVRGKSDDEVFPYICVSNGFDGGTALRVTPTTVRVVCSNTLHMVIPRYDSADKFAGVKPGNAAYVCTHVGTLKERVEEVKRALAGYTDRLRENRELIDALAARSLDSKATERFFLECFIRNFGAIADQPKDGKEQRHRDAALDAVGACVRRFDAELKVAGATAWNAFNAYSGWLQHDRKVHRKDATAAWEMRVHSNLFGDNADRTVDSFKAALTLAT